MKVNYGNRSNVPSGPTIEVIVEPGRRDTEESPHDFYWCVKFRGEVVEEDYVLSEAIAITEVAKCLLGPVSICSRTADIGMPKQEDWPFAESSQSGKGKPPRPFMPMKGKPVRPVMPEQIVNLIEGTYGGPVTKNGEETSSICAEAMKSLAMFMLVYSLIRIVDGVIYLLTGSSGWIQ